MASSENGREALAKRISAAAEHRFGASGLRGFEPLPGGHSGLTWRAELDLGRSSLPIVVKSTPQGGDPVGRHDVLRQARAVRALASVPGVEVPEVYFESQEPPQFFAMAMVEGRGEEPILDEGDDPEPAAELAELWRQIVSMLVAVGSPDPAELGLGDEPASGLEDELERWSATARAAGEETERPAAPLAARLRAALPAPVPPRLVHGDYRLGNTLRRGGRIAALIDWEIWGLGDPRTDLGWLLLFTMPDAFPGLGRAAPGTPDTAAVLAQYAEAGGPPVEEAGWFLALACFKLGSIQGHNLRRHREGRREDPFLERFAASVVRLFELGGEVLGGGL